MYPGASPAIFGCRSSPPVSSRSPAPSDIPIKTARGSSKRRSPPHPASSSRIVSSATTIEFQTFILGLRLSVLVSSYSAHDIVPLYQMNGRMTCPFDELPPLNRPVISSIMSLQRSKSSSVLIPPASRSPAFDLTPKSSRQVCDSGDGMGGENEWTDRWRRGGE